MVLRAASAPSQPKRKSALGQFMTPLTVARFMAAMFPDSDAQLCTLLDAGAGMGALSCAFLDRWADPHGGFAFQKVNLVAYEIDEALRGYLAQALSRYAERLALVGRISDADFIEAAAVEHLQSRLRFTHAILNPPYKKINSSSQHRLILRRAGIETVNLYSPFVALSLALMETGGQLVAIVPRSFSNGPYYRPFRQYLLANASIRQIHLFASRNKAFKGDNVLQENVIIRLERGGERQPVVVSNSTDDTFSDLTTHQHRFDPIVFPGDEENFIHVPTSLERTAVELSPGIRYSLTGIGVQVSTGPVVDFRLKDHIHQQPQPGDVPLLYPGNFTGAEPCWPKEGMKRGNAIARNALTERWLYPSGFYTVVRRFSAKEERRRIVASVVSPCNFRAAAMLGFENHLNVFHERRQGIPEALAHGLAVFLNTTAVDEQFRRFNGHTQVNATDLRLMNYPSRKALIALGEWALQQTALTQAMLDDQFNKMAA